MSKPYNVDVLIIGGGSAGMAAALEAEKTSAQKILLVERDRELGGILNQCIHSGFGLHYFKEELTGPEYAHRFIHQIKNSATQIWLNTTVLSIQPEKNHLGLSCQLINKNGVHLIYAKAVVLAMGCRERTAGAIALQGQRPAGVLNAGSAQRLINMEGLKIGKKAVIYGSGDIGLIMARRLTLEGCEVKAVLEIMPRCGGLRRNVEQCLEDFGIPLYLSHAITQVHGKSRLKKISVAPLNPQGEIQKEQEFTLDCDTLLLSVGLIPENELTRSCQGILSPYTKGPEVNSHLQTSIPGVFACGNVLHVHDIVDFVTEEGTQAGHAAALYALQSTYYTAPKTLAQLAHQGNISYVIPQVILEEKAPPCLRFRVKEPVEDFTLLLRDSASHAILLQKKMAFAEPSQMIHWQISPQDWQQLLSLPSGSWVLTLEKE